MSDLSILVVDDDVDIATNITDILGEFNYQADTAYCGAEALALVEANRYDVALLDFKMPDMDGATLYQSIKAIQPEMVAIMVTAYAGNDGVERAMSAGVWKVMRKPVQFDRLLESVEEAAGQPLVLVVDDDPAFCDGLWEVLRENGYRVGFAFSQAVARQQLETNDYRVVLLDVKLGGATTESLFGEFQNLKTCPATVIVSERDNRQDPLVSSMLKQGAKSVCYKPVEMASLLGQIEQHAGQGSNV